MEGEMTLDLGELIDIIKKRIKLIALLTIAATIVSGILSFFVIKPTYEAKSSIIIGKYLDLPILGVIPKDMEEAR